MNIKGFFKDKTIFLTGTTGFVGKVVLEKFMRSLPEFKRIYVMVRPKKSIQIQERLEKEILNSEIFDNLFAQHPGLKELMRTKVIAVGGDLVMEGLGISAEVRATLVRELDVIINVAASVNFNDPLLDAIQINYMGSMRMLELAKECQNLLVFTHVSTAYANSNRFNHIEEKIYDLEDGKDPDKIIEHIVKMGPQRVQEQEKQLIGKWPNTYTFTKYMAERSLKKNRGNLRIAVVRPSIIISCYDEPLRGWTDSLAAGGGLTFSIQLGLLNYV